jgi:hypothetical protein
MRSTLLRFSFGTAKYTMRLAVKNTNKNIKLEKTILIISKKAF